MSARQIGSELRMLAAGLLLGRLVLRKPAAPAPVVARIAEPAPKLKRKWLGLTQNALVTAVISVTLSGVVSYLVAHSQSQDAARQATAGEQVQEISQLEADTKTFYNAVHSYYKWRTGCSNLPSGYPIPPKCKQQDILDSPLVTDYVGAEGNLGTDLANISDPTARRFTYSLEGYADTALYNAGTEQGNTAWGHVDLEYYDVIQRCGLLIQGQT